MTKKILLNLPENIQKKVDTFKGRYKDDRFDHNISRAEARGYLIGLKDAGIIRDTEFRALYTYITL